MESKSALSMDQQLDAQREQEWQKTVSGRLYKQLEILAVREGKTVDVKNRGSIVETFQYGDEEVLILKQLEDAMVGEAGGKLVAYVEAHQYKRLPWWRQVIDAEGVPVQFLDTPISAAAEDAGIVDWEKAFRLSAILRSFQERGIDQKKHRTWVIDHIVSVARPLLAPHYDVRFVNHTIRMVPLTPEAEESRLNDNAVYTEALETLRGVSDQLQQDYQRKMDEERLPNNA